MEFRRATNEDCAVIKNVVFAVLTEYGLNPDSDGTDLDISDLERFYFLKGGFFEVCEVDGQIVGTWGVCPLTDGACDLKKMYLLKSHRGKGYGRAMLDRAIGKARELGFKRMELETAGVLKEAIALYLSYGFKPKSGRRLVSRCDQAFQLCL
jgi:putative acetyltransferase